jgi:hypothetical protein
MTTLADLIVGPDGHRVVLAQPHDRTGGPSSTVVQDQRSTQAGAATLGLALGLRSLEQAGPPGDAVLSCPLGNRELPGPSVGGSVASANRSQHGGA